MLKILSAASLTVILLGCDAQKTASRDADAAKIEREELSRAKNEVVSLKEKIASLERSNRELSSAIEREKAVARMPMAIPITPRPKTELAQSVDFIDSTTKYKDREVELCVLAEIPSDYDLRNYLPTTSKVEIGMVRFSLTKHKAEGFIWGNVPKALDVPATRWTERLRIRFRCTMGDRFKGNDVILIERATDEFQDAARSK